MKIYSSIKVAVLFAIVAGCQPPAPSPSSVETSPDGKASTGNAGTSESRPPKKNEDGPVTTTSAQPNNEEAALASVTRAMRAIHSGTLEEVFDFLPPSFQNNIDDEVRALAKRIGPDRWGKIVGLVDSARHVVEEKQGLLASSPLFYHPERDSKQLLPRFASAASCLKSLLQSELATHEHAVNFSTRRFLETTGTPAARDLRRAIGLEVLNDTPPPSPTIVPGGNLGSVLLKFDDKPSSPPVEFVLVEGKWIPRTLVDDWPATIAKIRSILAQAVPEQESSLKAADQKLEAAGQFLDELLKAKNQSAFDASLMTAYFLLDDWIRKSAGSQKQKIATPVKLILDRELNESEQAKTRDHLLSCVDQPARFFQSLSVSTGETTIYVSPVGDMKEFSKRIRLGEVDRFDETTRTIWIKTPTR